MSVKVPSAEIDSTMTISRVMVMAITSDCGVDCVYVVYVCTTKRCITCLQNATVNCRAKLLSLLYFALKGTG